MQQHAELAYPVASMISGILSGTCKPVQEFCHSRLGQYNDDEDSTALVADVIIWQVLDQIEMK